MATIKSLEADFEKLKKENLQIKKRISEIEKQIQPAQINIPEEKVDAPVIDAKPVGTETEEKGSTKNTAGIILIVIGAILCMTGIGIILGLPLLIIGIIIVSKDNKTNLTEKKSGLAGSKEVLKDNAKSFEEDIGMKWFGRIGILALVIGIGFFIKYAIDNEWINHLTRIILGVVFGIALIIFGSVISKNEKYANWAKTLVGGGFAITYFVIYSAYQFEEYRLALGISQLFDIILLSAVVLIATIFSIKDNSQVIAGESFFLGYITTLLTNDFGMLTLSYGMLLTLGLVIVVSKKRWFAIGLGGMIASYLLYVLWRADNPDSFAYASFILMFYFIAFFIQSFYIEKEALKGKAVVLSAINSIVFFLLYYGQVDSHFSKYTGLFTLVFALLHFLSYYVFTLKKAKEMEVASLYLAIFYLTLAVPIQLNKEFVTLIWAAEAVLLTLLWINLSNNTFKISSLILGVFTALKALTYDMINLGGFDIKNILSSTRFFSLLTAVIAFYFTYFYLKRHLNADNLLPKIYSWMATLYLVLMIFSEFNEYKLFITFALAVIALTLNMMSAKRYGELKIQSFVVATILFLKILFYDSTNLDAFDPSDLLSSTRMMAFAIGILAMYILSHLEEKNKLFSDILTYLGSILVFFAIFMEMKEFWVSVGWSFFALLIIILGIRFSKRHLRLQGIIIFMITIFKVFVYDIRNLELVYRTVSYMVLGIILLLVSFLYTKYKDKFKEIL